MMDRLRNAMRDEAIRTQDRDATPRMGVVTAYDPNQYAVKVKVLPEGQFVDGAAGETGWLPLQTDWVGNGWGMLRGPNINDQVMVLFQEHDPGAGHAAKFVFDSTNQPPNPGPPSGEFWLIHKEGQYLKFTNDGNILLGSDTEIDIGRLSNPTLALVTEAFMALYNGHTHNETGTVTLHPNQQMTDDHLTAILKAN